MEINQERDTHLVLANGFTNFISELVENLLVVGGCDVRPNVSQEPAM